jgi:hypothetical protein
MSLSHRITGLLIPEILTPSFRDGPKDQTSDVQVHIGKSQDSGFTAARRPGMTLNIDEP